MPFGTEKLEWCGYPTVKKSLMTCLFVLTQLTDTRTHRQTDRHRTTAYRPRLCIAARGKNLTTPLYRSSSIVVVVAQSDETVVSLASDLDPWRVYT